MRILLIVLLALLALFQYEFWFDKSGYLDYKNVQAEIAQRQAENTQLSHRNQLIAAEIKDLKEGVDAVEEKARVDHDMVKPNERLYRIISANSP